MVKDMSDGLVNIVEHKVTTNMMSMKVDYNGPVVDKIEQIKKGTYKIDLKNWEQVDTDNQFT